MLNRIRRTIREKGQGLTEYVLILAFIAGVAFMMFGGNGSLKDTLVNTFAKTVYILEGLFDERDYAGYFTDWRKLKDADLATINNSERIRADHKLMYELAKAFIGKKSDEAQTLFGWYTNLNQSTQPYDNILATAGPTGDGEYSDQLVLLATWDHYNDKKDGYTTLGRQNQGNNAMKDYLTNNEADIYENGSKTHDRVFFSEAMTGDNIGRRVTAVLHYGTDSSGNKVVESVIVNAQKAEKGNGNNKNYQDIPGYSLTVTGSGYTLN